MELLVVIAIVAVIAAILFPVLNSAKKKAYQTTCLNNVAQITKAQLIYASSNDGGLPWAFRDPECWLDAIGLRGSVGRCPAYRDSDDAVGFADRSLQGYAMNNCQRVRQQVLSEARTVLVAECALFTQDTPDHYFYPDYLSGPDIFQYAAEHNDRPPRFFVVGDYGSIRHQGGAIYGFFDGHAKWLRPREIRLQPLAIGYCSPQENAVWAGPEEGATFLSLP